MRCRSCGYDLRGIDERRCPECAAAFDPQAPDTFLARPVSGQRQLAIAGLAGMFVAGSIAAQALVRLPDPATELLMAVLLFPFGPAMFIVGTVMAGGVLRKSYRVYTGRHPWVTERSLLLAATVMSCVVMATFVASCVLIFLLQ